MNSQETKQCPYCGEEILAIAKKCKYCNEWLDKEAIEPKKKKKVSNEYSDVKAALQRVIKSEIDFSIIISIGDFWVQFANFDSQLTFSAVSYEFLPHYKIDNKDNEFQQLGFYREDGTSYYKNISVTNISKDKIIQEIKTIFETIYGVKFDLYKIEDVEEIEEESFISRNSRWLHPIFFAVIGWVLFFFGSWHLILGRKISMFEQYMMSGELKKQDFFWKEDGILLRINEGWWGFVMDGRFFDAPFIQWCMLGGAIGAFGWAIWVLIFGKD